MLLTMPPLAAGEPVAPRPIPDSGTPSGPPFVGTSGVAARIRAPRTPRHPFMARNERSNIHSDAYMTDVYRRKGPRGRTMERLTTFFLANCATVTFDRRGRVLSVCVAIDRPTLRLFDPKTLATLAELPLPARPPGGDPFSDFSGGGYFYLDDGDRAFIPSFDRHILVVAVTGGWNDPAFVLERDYDLTAALADDDRIVSALPDWSGRIWFVSLSGVVGTIEPTSGQVRTLPLGEGITNSFATDETGGVFIVSDRAMYRFAPDPDGGPSVIWREVYANIGIRKPGQVDDGSGTTPTLVGNDYVAITDNADPMNVVVYRRAAEVSGSRVVCTQPVFGEGASATDNSLIAAGNALIVENNYGYTGPAATSSGQTTTPGIERVDIDEAGTTCRTVWHSDEIAPSVVPKVSLRTGLVYTYTKPSDPSGVDAWYLTAIDFHTGETRWKQLAGTGTLYNNHYAPISVSPRGRAVSVGTLGGLVLLRDGRR